MSDYDPIAERYHWLIPDEMLSGEAFVERHEDLLASLPLDAQILDCACGIGIDAIALTRRGFNVCGSDASDGLVAQARRRARQARVEVRFEVCSWEDLPEQFGGGRFDAVLCVGNSISHSPGPQAMVRSFEAMRKVLKEGGTLVVDSRNWEKLWKDRPRVAVAPRVVEREGVRCVPIYFWTFPALWEDPHSVDVMLLFLDEQGGITHKFHRLEYRPFRVEELVARLQEAGLVEIRSAYGEDVDRYEVRARRASGA